MSQEGMFVVVLTVQRGTGRLLTSPDIISRGFIYLRDSEELMNMIRQYLKQKAARSFAGKYDLDVVKKEIKDEITHILYDQTRRTPIVIPVINEVGGLKTVKSTAASSTSTAKTPVRSKKPAAASAEEPKMTLPTMPRRRFPRRQVPDTEANDTKARERHDVRAY